MNQTPSGMKKFANSNIKINISIAFILAFFAFIAVQLLSNNNIQNIRDSFHRVSDSRQLSKMIGAVGSSIKSYHSKVIEFVLTGNEKFLEGNEENLRDVNINLQNILDAPVSAEQSSLVNQLDSLVKSEINFCEKALIAYDKENTNDAVALINTGTGEQLINDITSTSRQIREIEENNLAQIIRNNDFFSRRVAYMDYAATSFAVIVILFSLFVIFRDINKRTKVERQLRIAQERAEQSAIMKEQFMANMSHEIRTPMNSIIGFANLLSQSRLDDKQKRQVDAIQSSGENLLNIINDILDYSKIESGMMNIEKIPFSPAGLLHSVNMMFLPKAVDKNLQFEFYTSSQLPQTVLGDPTRLTQILVNLINNALKFTIEGSIWVKTELLNEENENVIIQFSVKDTGIGIPKEKLQEIFERFIQANADTSRVYGGSGLGLSITKKLIELQGGTIEVQSAEGVGSSFSFSIPYKQIEVPVLSPKLPKPSSAIKSKIKVLVAEDNLLNQHLAESLLAQWGFEFDIVENGNLAIKKLKRNEYDLVLMDIQMPEMNGYDTSRFIRQNLHLDLPIIAMTAHVLPGEKDKCLSYGMTDYISKPIRENELYNLIVKYVGTAPKKIKAGNNSRGAKKNSSIVTNLDYVKELSSGDPVFVNNMIELFLSENPKDIRQLEDAIIEADFERIKTVSHKIKSNISFAGLDSAISNELSEIEESALRKENLSQIEILFSRVKDICLKAIAELKDLKSSHAQ